MHLHHTGVLENILDRIGAKGSTVLQTVRRPLRRSLVQRVALVAVCSLSLLLLGWFGLGGRQASAAVAAPGGVASGSWPAPMKPASR
jgi:hypothetical protein